MSENSFTKDFDHRVPNTTIAQDTLRGALAWHGLFSICPAEQDKYHSERNEESLAYKQEIPRFSRNDK